ncbi:MAG: ABC transporter ATP-binding protein [Rhizobiales bacterium]|nr:ABC transporter ATP-binding protein [Hyphomicrobiales bacterium]
MAHISIKNLTVEFKVYGSSSRSLKNQILSQATGGRIAENADDAVTVKALDNVSLEINDGDRIGLVGHNGAGKSTLLRTLAGIYKPTEGSIEIEGTVGTLIDPSAGMDPEATGIENVYLRGYILGMCRHEIDEKVDEIAEFTELGDFLHLPVKTYSAGMFSRLGFAISTAISPEILLIDEGVGTGDNKFIQKISARIKSYFDRASIVVIATHDDEILKSIGATNVLFEHGANISQVK